MGQNQIAVKGLRSVQASSGCSISLRETERAMGQNQIAVKGLRSVQASSGCSISLREMEQAMGFEPTTFSLANC